MRRKAKRHSGRSWPASSNTLRARSSRKRSTAAPSSSNGMRGKLRSRQAEWLEGARRRRVDQQLRRRLDRLRRALRDQARRPRLHPIRNRQSGNRDVQRRAPRGRRNPRRAVGKVRHHLGQHGEESAVDLPFRRQPDDPCDDARGSRRGMDARSCRRSRPRITAASPKITKWRTNASSAKAAARA